MNQMSDALIKAGIANQKRAERVEIELIVDEVVALLRKELREKVKSPMPTSVVFPMMTTLYMDDKTRKFFIHIIRAFANQSLTTVLDTWGIHQVLTCPLCSATMFVRNNFDNQLSTIVKQIVKNDTKKRSPIIKAIRDFFEMRRYAVDSTASSKIICISCRRNLIPWMRHTADINKEDKFIRYLLSTLAPNRRSNKSQAKGNNDL